MSNECIYFLKVDTASLGSTQPTVGRSSRAPTAEKVGVRSEKISPAYANGSGDLLVHEVATSQVRRDLAYYSYYAGGFRVAKVQGGKLVEVGHFIDEGGNNFWGVQVFQRNGKEYVAASDMDYGLYIFQYTGRQ